MPKFKICPRCELNWIKDSEELCEVCKAQLSNKQDLFQDEDDELCPLCKTNFIEPGEKYCLECLEKRRAKGIVDSDTEVVDEQLKPEEGLETVSYEDILEKEDEPTEDETFDDVNTTYQADFSDDAAIAVEPIDDEDLFATLEEGEEEESFDDSVVTEEEDDELEKDFKVTVNPEDFEGDEDEEDELELRKKKLKENKDNDD